MSGSLDQLLAEHNRLGLQIDARTNRNGGSFEFDLGCACDAVWNALN